MSSTTNDMRNGALIGLGVFLIAGGVLGVVLSRGTSVFSWLVIPLGFGSIITAVRRGGVRGREGVHASVMFCASMLQIAGGTALASSDATNWLAWLFIVGGVLGLAVLIRDINRKAQAAHA